MEYVEGTTLRELMANWGSFQRNSEYYYSRVELALRLLLSFPVPQDATPGPRGGGLIRHPLFKDYLAPIQYGSVDELEGHLNTVSSSLPVGSSGYLFRKQVANFRNPSSSSTVKLPTVKLEGSCILCSQNCMKETSYSPPRERFVSLTLNKRTLCPSVL